MVNKWYKLTSAGLFCIGLTLIALGVALPIVLNQQIDAGVNDLWIQPSDFDTWGETPGKYGLKVVREFTIFNVTNPDEIILGDKPRLVEVGPFPYQEYSDYLAYNYKLTLQPLKNNVTNTSLDTPVTAINAFFYLAFLGLAKAPAPLYGMEFLHDVLVTFETDLYFLTVAKTLWDFYFSNEDFTQTYLSQLGFSTDTIGVLMNDPVYGFGSYQTLKIWVQAQVDYNTTGSWDDGAMDILQNYFNTVPALSVIIQPGSVWSELTQGIQADMQARYMTSDRHELALIQWSVVGVTGDMPLDQGPLSPPVYQGLNSTAFDFYAEIGALVQFLGLPLDKSFLEVADHLLTPDYSYPMTNNNSLLNRNNIGTFYADYQTENFSSILSQCFPHRFDLQSYEQIDPIYYYLGAMGDLQITLPDDTTQYDGYSLALSRFVHKSLVNETVNLRNDAYYGILTREVFCYFQRTATTCQSVVAQGTTNATLQLQVCSDSVLFWNINDSNSWVNLETWVKAALKTNSSAAFNTLASQTMLTPGILNRILYTSPNSLQVVVQSALNNITQHYQCSNNHCTYDYLFYLQWSSSGVTNNLSPELLQCGVVNTLMIQDWLPGRYRVPIEWLEQTKVPLPEPQIVYAAEILNYNTFLNPTVLKLFFNSYLARNLTATIDKFHLPSNMVGVLYNYFLNIIPGYGLFTTYTVDQWLTGVADPFIMFINNMTVYEGGDPSINSIQKMATETNDTSSTPKHIMHTGKHNTSLTRQYYAYYGHHDMDMYWPGYDAYAPDARAWLYTDIWNGSKPIAGSDGGQYGTRMKQTDEPQVFISSVLRWFQLKYLYSFYHDGLELYRYVMDESQLQTGAENPANYYFYQDPSGLNGFMNITTQFSAPVFVNLPHCFQCDEDGINMIEYFSYPDVNGTQVRIYPNQATDQPFADIEPLTGAGVNLVLLFSSNMGLYKDYFFPDFYEVSPGAPLYHPYYILKRSVNYTEGQIDQVFGSLILARKLEIVFRVGGLIAGTLFVLAAFVLVCLLFRKAKPVLPEYHEMLTSEDAMPRKLNRSN